jgi:membrane protease YdiL (CAAX protease family)
MAPAETTPALPSDPAMVPPGVEAVSPVPPPDQAPAAWVLPPRKPGPGILAAIGWVILFLALQAGIVVAWVVWDKLVGRGAVTIIIPVVAAGFILEVGLVALALRGDFLRALAVRSIHPLHVLLVLALVLPLATLDISTALWASGLNRQGAGQDVPEIYKGLTDLSVPALVVIACLLPGLGEEIFFRGFLARGLVARYGLLIGVAVSAGLFGLMHADSTGAAHIISTTMLGVAAYLVFLAAKTIWAPFLLHALNNGLAFGTGKLAAYLGDEMPDRMPDFPVMLVLTAAAAVFALMVVFYQTRTRWILPDGSAWAPGYLTTEMPPRMVAARPTIALPQLWAIGAALAACGGFGWALVTSF